MLRQRSIAWLVALASACSSGDAGIPIERFEGELAEAVCAAAERCDVGTSAWTDALGSRCRDGLERVIGGEGGFARARSAVAARRMTYDPEAARACIESFENRCPPCTEMDPEEWCPEAFGGDCRTPSKARWQAPASEGQACGVDALCCGAGLSCQESPTGAPSSCRARLAAGSACSLDGDCGQGSACVEGVCQAPAVETSQSIRDELGMDRPKGTSCEPSDFFKQGLCNAGLVCHLDTMTCGAPKASGAPCQSSGECAGVCEPDGEAAGNGQCADPPACSDDEPTSTRTNVPLPVSDAGVSPDPDPVASPAPCIPGTLSTPGMDGDPCPQAVGSAPTCPGLGTTHMAVSICQADGRWSSSCECTPRSAGSGTAGSGA